MGGSCSSLEFYERCITSILGPETECRRSFGRPWRQWDVNITAGVRGRRNVWILLLVCFELSIEVSGLGTERIDRLCGLVVRVRGYRSGGPGSIPGTTKKKSSGSGTGFTQPREYN
jgi:hypothetical protein